MRQNRSLHKKRQTQGQRQVGAFDLLDLPLAGHFMRWQHARSALGFSLLLITGLMVFDGFAGPQLAPKNLATTLTWVHYRGFVAIALLVAGNLFCLACPFMFARNLARRVFQPSRIWPRWLRHKGVALVLFVLVLFAYELFDLWSTPLWTAWLIVTYFATALAVDSLFRGAAFCKYVCPLGQFNFVAALTSPLEVKVRDPRVCTDCRTKDCIKGRPDSPFLHGCELWLFQPGKFGNMDCTFCLDCVHACPYSNVGISPRLPASELWADPRRSGIGRFSRRPDLAALAIVFAFGALLNAFGMVSPVYAVEAWLGGLLGTGSELPVLAIVFFVSLGVLPAVLLGTASWISQHWAGAAGEPHGGWVTRYAYTLVPLGFGTWLAHYSFHFLSGFWTFVPVIQSFVRDLAGSTLMGTPRWDLGPLLPPAWLNPLEIGFLGLGWFGSLLVAYRLAEQDRPAQPLRVFLPWAALLLLLLAAAIWLMSQPMEMRGMMMAG